MRVERRDFLLIRAVRPAVLSCEQLFMRFLDAEADGSTARLFAHLADDLRGVHVVQIVDASWRGRDDFARHLDPVLEQFTSSGGRVEG